MMSNGVCQDGLSGHVALSHALFMEDEGACGGQRRLTTFAYFPQNGKKWPVWGRRYLTPFGLYGFGSWKTLIL